MTPGFELFKRDWSGLDAGIINAVVQYTNLRMDLIEQFLGGLRHDVSRLPTGRKFVEFTELQKQRI